jgi:REP element-mobilizing transposase RayT
MTLPREVLPGQFYMVTRRCTQRQFLLRPDRSTNNAFIYCLAEAAQRFEIDVVLATTMSNHYHAVVYDRFGRLPQFTEHFHKMFARCQNALRGRWENLWSSEQVCVVRLVRAEDILRKLVYVATNPVKDHLVARVHHWPGVNGLKALVSASPMRATRPRHFFRADGSMPEEVSLQMALPAELGNHAEMLSNLLAEVAAAEIEADNERRRNRIQLIGRGRILRQSWWDSPSTPERRRNLRPQIAARSTWARVEAILRNRDFLLAYREARALWALGQPSTFPVGTYWLRRFAAVPVA